MTARNKPAPLPPGSPTTGPADSAWLRRSLDALGLSQVDLSRLVGVSTVSVSGWAVGRHPVPPSVARFLEVLDALPETRRRAIRAAYRLIDRPEA